MSECNHNMNIAAQKKHMAAKLWLQYFNNYLWKNGLIDWQVYNKMRLRIRQTTSCSGKFRRPS